MEDFHCTLRADAQRSRGVQLVCAPRPITGCGLDPGGIGHVPEKYRYHSIALNGSMI